jgi:RNA polymerase-interacting CarD/CdnL/TRCF family regulator
MANELLQQIDEALRSHCGIAAKQYFVAAISEDGKSMTFFSPSQKLNDVTIRQFFDMNKFQQVMARVDAGKVQSRRHLVNGKGGPIISIYY